MHLITNNSLSAESTAEVDRCSVFTKVTFYPVERLFAFPGPGIVFQKQAHYTGTKCFTCIRVINNSAKCVHYRAVVTWERNSISSALSIVCSKNHLFRADKSCRMIFRNGCSRTNKTVCVCFFLFILFLNSWQASSNYFLLTACNNNCWNDCECIII